VTSDSAERQVKVAVRPKWFVPAAFAVAFTLSFILAEVMGPIGAVIGLGIGAALGWAGAKYIFPVTEGKP